MTLRERLEIATENIAYLEAELAEARVAARHCHPAWWWRYWPLSHLVVGWLYEAGVVSGSSYTGRCNQWCDGHPGRGFQLGFIHACLPGRGPYLLGRSMDSWRVLYYHVRMGWPHSPGPIVHGFCGKCAPWPCCGAVGYAHADTCREA